MLAAMSLSLASCSESVCEPSYHVDTPVILVGSATPVVMPVEVSDFRINYKVLHQVPEVMIKAESDSKEWLSVDECLSNRVNFSVRSNTTGETRRGVIVLSYPGAEPVAVSIVQGDVAQNPGLVAPEFTAISAESITATSATLVCTVNYSGESTVSSIGVAYKPIWSTEYQTSNLGASLGSKRASLTGLDTDTEYVYYFYAVVGDETFQSAYGAFRTGASGSSTVSGTYRSGWPELPVEDKSNSDYYYAHHMCPNTLNTRNYTVCFSAKHHCPVWVAAPRHDCFTGSASRSDAYAPDPQIPSNIQYQQKTSGNSTYNRGHMLGSAERTASTAINQQVFYYTNIAPQNTNTFNNGGRAWNKLEDYIDKQVCRDTTYVVIGTYFDDYTDSYGNTSRAKKINYGGRTDVSCPTMFYYAVLRTKSGSTGKAVKDCAASELKCAAFVLCHDVDMNHQPSARDMMSVTDLEKLTGHTFFSNVPNAPKSTYTASEWGL